MFMKKRTKDLILDNDYNSNNIYFEALPQIQMDQSFKNKTDGLCKPQRCPNGMRCRFPLGLVSG